MEHTTLENSASRAPLRFIDLREVREITGLSTTTIYQLIREKQFPDRRRIGKRSVRWVEAEVHQWLLQVADENILVSLSVE